MKNLTLNNVNLETRIAICNFCGEDNKDCIKSVVPNKFSYWNFKTKHEWVDEGFWNIGRLVSIIEGQELKTTEMFSGICKDCIKQLAKLI